MSNLFYEQLERGYHGIPEGLIPLSVIDEIKAEIRNKIDENMEIRKDGVYPNEYAYCYENVLKIIDEKVKEYTS